ncbi:MAG: hypothetical protein WKF83_11360 [Nocardioidaceae bacterium]
MAEPDRDAARQMWHDYLASQPAQFSGEESLPDVDGFGDSRELADELIALVLDGIKRATAGLVADYEAAGEPCRGRVITGSRATVPGCPARCCVPPRCAWVAWTASTMRSRTTRVRRTGAARRGWPAIGRLRAVAALRWASRPVTTP